MIKSQLPVYPSQLEEFKKKADSLAELIERKANLSKISAFKRYDYLSIALGYKGHSDLIQRSKKIAVSDNHSPLLIYSENAGFQKQIIETLHEKINGLSQDLSISIVKALGVAESVCSLMFEDNSALRKSLSSYNYPSRSIADKGRTVLTIDFSRAPSEVSEAVKNSKIFQLLVQLFTDKEDRALTIETILSKPSSHDHNFDAQQKNSKIDISFDLIGTPQLNVSAMTAWQSMTKWLFLFQELEVFNVSQRINSQQWCSLVVQKMIHLTSSNTASIIASARAEIHNAEDLRLFDTLYNLRQHELLERK